VRNSPGSTGAGEGGGEEALQAGAGIPHRETMGEQLEDPRLEQVNIPEGATACGEPTLEQVYPEGLQLTGGTPAHQGRGKA